MRLRLQYRKEYNVFNINSAYEPDTIVLRQFDEEGDLEEHNRLDAE